jgi:hypothetical protein
MEAWADFVKPKADKKAGAKAKAKKPPGLRLRACQTETQRAALNRGGFFVAFLWHRHVVRLVR